MGHVWRGETGEREREHAQAERGAPSVTKRNHRPLTPATPPFPLTQEFGARAPKAGELESNFSDKVLGHWDTSHIIR